MQSVRLTTTAIMMTTTMMMMILFDFQCSFTIQDSYAHTYSYACMSVWVHKAQMEFKLFPFFFLWTKQTEITDTYTYTCQPVYVWIRMRFGVCFVHQFHIYVLTSSRSFSLAWENDVVCSRVCVCVIFICTFSTLKCYTHTERECDIESKPAKENSNNWVCVYVNSVFLFSTIRTIYIADDSSQESKHNCWLSYDFYMLFTFLWVCMCVCVCVDTLHIRY